MANKAPEILSIGMEPQDDVSLLGVLDHVFNAGVVIRGSVVISLAGVDLLYVGLNAVVTSVETALRHTGKPVHRPRNGPGRN